jgi:hypothetical protein
VSLVLVSDLLAGSRLPEHCIAISGSERINLARFRADILYNAEWLAAQSVKRGATVCDSGYWFIVGLLALLKVGADVILPPNSQTGTLRSLEGEIDLLLIDCDTIGARKEHRLRPSQVVVESFHADLGEGRLYFFTSGSTGEMKRVEKSLAMFEREAALLEQKWGGELCDIPSSEPLPISMFSE